MADSRMQLSGAPKRGLAITGLVLGVIDAIVSIIVSIMLVTPTGL